VAQSREQSEALVGSLLAEFFSTGLVLLALIGTASVLIGVLTVRSELRPLRLASAAATRVEPARPGLRLPEAGLPGEVTPLVAAVNQALARLEVALSAQRRFVGDAAHTLRTPLAVLTARLDSLAEGPDTLALRRDADRMTRLIDQMLQMARLDGMPLDVSQPVHLRAAAVEAISALAPLALQRGVQLALSEPALTNLVENALAYAPPGSLVEVTVEPPARVLVLDRGPGVPEAERSLIFERFGRGQATGSTGAGLGLAIVAGIATAHRGSVRAMGRDGGGAAFALELST
jgi:signal transduction histidine kinase